VPIRDDVPWEEVPLTIPPEAADNCHVFVAESNQQKRENNQTIDYAEIKDIGAHNMLIIGGESHGVSEEAYRYGVIQTYKLENG